MSRSPQAPPLPTTKLGIWYLASRPRSLTATYIPVGLGSVLAWNAGKFNIAHFFLALVGALALQISANLVNEYFDYKRGSDANKTQGLGMIIARGLLPPQDVLIGAIVTLVLGVVIGLYFVAVTGLTILWIGLGGVLAVILYSAGPLPLSDIGLGELTVFIFMGPLLVFGMYFVLTETYDSTPLWASLPIAFLTAVIMHANNLRDLDADASKHKHTLAVTFGRKFAQNFYRILIYSAFVCTFLLVLIGVAPILVLLVVILVPTAYKLVKDATSTEEVPILHGVLIRTAGLHKTFGVVYLGAWLVDVFVRKIF